ncbi:MAG: hypothetical protein JNK82_18560 [Myxococcaceae bacterium]|nr:hypothetical protein [Myxococcaceae bacterium]
MARLKRAASEELTWVAHFFAGAGAAIALVAQTPVTLLPAIAAGLALFGLLFVAYLWKPTALIAISVMALFTAAAFTFMGAAFGGKLGLGPDLSLYVGGGVGVIAGIFLGVLQARELVFGTAGAQR